MQIVAQAERDKELIRRLTAATAAITREMVTTMTSAQGKRIRVIDAIITQDDGTKYITPQKDGTNKTGPPLGGQL